MDPSVSEPRKQTQRREQRSEPIFYSSSLGSYERGGLGIQETANDATGPQRPHRTGQPCGNEPARHEAPQRPCPEKTGM